MENYSLGKLVENYGLEKERQIFSQTLSVSNSISMQTKHINYKRKRESRKKGHMKGKSAKNPNSILKLRKHINYKEKRWRVEGMSRGGKIRKNPKTRLIELFPYLLKYISL